MIAAAPPPFPPPRRLSFADKVVSLVQLPEVLCIHLKRFNFHHMWGSKATTEVSFPLSGLDMAPYLVPGGMPDLLPVAGAGSGGGAAPSSTPLGPVPFTAPASSSSRTCAVAPAGGITAEPAPIYDLVSVVQHIGSLHGACRTGIARRSQPPVVPRLWGLSCQRVPPQLQGPATVL